MKLEELVQMLEAAAPWTIKRVESVFASASSLARSNNAIAIHTMGPFCYEEKLIIEEVHLRVRTNTNKMSRLIISLSEDAGRFTFDRIKSAWPDIRIDPSTYPRGQSWDEKRHYQTNRPWGRLSFGFKERQPDCLASITFIPKERVVTR